MKELLAVISLLVLGAVAEPPAPYPPSGWRPSGPSFELPQRGSQQPQNYLPPVDPRNPPGPQADEDVSVQGLPQPEQQPLFQASPISGQQYAGPNFNKDLKNLDESFQQTQYQQQQERYREYQRQKELEAAKSNRLPAPNNPRQFARTSTTEAPTTPQVTSTTGFDLNQEEILNESEPVKFKTSVEVTKQNVKEYPGEFFLSSLAQLQLQPQFLQLQTSGAYAQPAPISGAYIQPQPQKQLTGFDGPAHFSALPSVLARQKSPIVQNEQPLLVQQPISQFAQAQVTQYQPQPQIQAQYQPDSVVLQAPAQFQPNVYIKPNPDAVAVQPTSQYTPANSYQPAAQPQFIAQPVAFQPQQPNFAQQPEDESQEQQNQNNQNQQQFYQQPIIVQPFPAQNQQDQFYQPQGQYDQAQNQYAQPQTQFLQPGQPQFLQPQPNDPQNQYTQSQLAPQGQYGQPQGQFIQPQGQFVQPQLAQPEIQYVQPQYAQPQLAQGQFQQPQSADIQNQYLQPQLAQPQAQIMQPQAQFMQPQPQFLQPQLADPQNQYLQPQYAQPQLADPQNQYLQPQYAQPQNQYQPQFQGQDNLQSGLDINQQGNDINEPEDDDVEGATAVATAFGTRTQPRVNTRYGAPFPVPKVQASPGFSTTTESAVEEITEEGPAVAQAVAVANGERRKSARLRTRRIRPVYAVDRSGRLVLAEA